MDARDYADTDVTPDASNGERAREPKPDVGSITNMSDINSKVGPELPEMVVLPFTKLLGEPLDEAALRVKRALYPRPMNAPTLKVPRLNGWLAANATDAHLQLDHSLQNVQSYMVASMSAVATQAHALNTLKHWALHSSRPEISEKADTFANSFDTLMDASDFMTRAMYETSQVRREVIKQGLSNSLLELLVDEQKPTGDWLVGVDAREGNLSMLTPTRYVSESTHSPVVKVEGAISTALYPAIVNDLSDTTVGSDVMESDDATGEWSPPSSVGFETVPHVSEKTCACLDGPILRSQAAGKADVSSVHDKAHGTLGELAKHTETVNEQVTYACFACGKKVREYNALREHMKTHSRETHRVCSDSSGQIIQSSLITLQLSPVRGNDLPESQTRSIKDSDATEQWSKPSVVMFHKGTQTSENLNARIAPAAKESGLPSEAGEKSNTCSVCGKGFKWLSDVKRHMDTHTAGSPHKCSDCGITFGDMSSLADHVRTHVGAGTRASLDQQSAPSSDATIEPDPVESDSFSDGAWELLLDDAEATKKGSPPSGARHKRTEKTKSTAEKPSRPLQAGKKTHVCSVCGRKCQNASTLAAHVRIHTGEKPYTCSVCGKDFHQVGVRNRHMATQHGDKPKIARARDPYTCEHCGKAFNILKSLTVHIRTHTGEDRHVCQDCGKEFPFLSGLKRHALVHTGEKAYECSKCGKRFAVKCDLERHVKHHPRKPPACSFCSREFALRHELRAHLLTHTGERPHLCELCGQSFTSAAAQKVHVRRIHIREKPYACTQCDKSFVLPWNLKQHIRIHTGEKPHLCSECGATYSHVESLKIHMRTHTGEKNHKCKECGKAFAEPITLKVHMRSHTGEKPYHCSYCTKSFISSTMLNVHKRIHTGEKPYSCSDCGKRFSQSSSLKTHKRIHTGERPYVCSSCGKAFSEAATLRSHMRSHAGAQPYKPPQMW